MIGATGIVAVWSTAEPCLGIVAACLPTVWPVFTKLLSKLATIQSGLSYSWNVKKATGSSSTAASRSIDKVYGDFQPLQDLHADPRMDTYITSGQGTRGSAVCHGVEVPPNAIEVSTTMSRSGK